MAFLHVREAREHLVQRHFGPSLDVKRTFRFGKDYLDLTGEEMRLARYGADNFMYARVRHGMIDFKYGNMAMNQETCEELIATRMEAEGAVVTGEEDFSNKVCIQNVRNLKPGTPFGLDIHGQFIVYGLVQGWIQGVDQNGKGTIIITMLQASHNWIDSVINQ